MTTASSTAPSLLNASLPGASWHNSYATLPKLMFTAQAAEPVKQPGLLLLNEALADELGLDVDSVEDHILAEFFSGNRQPAGTSPLAQAYAGHQFGNLAILGDGRSVLIGEHETPTGQLVDLQLKGSGRTPYSRRGDGRAGLGPMLREYIISEAMAALGVPTTRALAVVTTGEAVYREQPQQGAILTRVASSHLRVGTFEYAAVKRDEDALEDLITYALKRHAVTVEADQVPAVALLQHMVRVQARLIAQWMSLGFIHGVMNTDNMTISGETIDYGPCAFMDKYNPATVFSSIDQWGRYAYGNQPSIGQWNIARLAEAILPAIHVDQDTAIKMAEAILADYVTQYEADWLDLFRQKLGLIGGDEGDKALIDDLLALMVEYGADFTRTFRQLSDPYDQTDPLYLSEEFGVWKARWQQRRTQGQTAEQSDARMNSVNPVVIPRNHLVEEALSSATDGDMQPFTELLDEVTRPFETRPHADPYALPDVDHSAGYRTFCGT